MEGEPEEGGMDGEPGDKDIPKEGMEGEPGYDKEKARNIYIPAPPPYPPSEKLLEKIKLDKEGDEASMTGYGKIYDEAPWHQRSEKGYDKSYDEASMHQSSEKGYGKSYDEASMLQSSETGYGLSALNSLANSIRKSQANSIRKCKSLRIAVLYTRNKKNTCCDSRSYGRVRRHSTCELNLRIDSLANCICEFRSLRLRQELRRCQHVPEQRSGLPQELLEQGRD